MKKSTIVLIVICVASLVLGIIFSVASVVSLKSYGVKQFGEMWEENKDDWSMYDVRIKAEDGTEVFVKIPLPDIYYDEETGTYDGPYFGLNIDNRRGNVVIEKSDKEEDSNLDDNDENIEPSNFD